VNIANLATAFNNLKVDGTALDARPILGSTVIAKASASYLPSGDLNGDTRATQMDSGAVDYTGDSATVAKLGTAVDMRKLAAPSVTTPSNMSGSTGSAQALQNRGVMRSSNPAALASAQRFSIRSTTASNGAKANESSMSVRTAASNGERADLHRSRLLNQVVGDLQGFAF
jgi:hypothetical protein